MTPNSNVYDDGNIVIKSREYLEWHSHGCCETETSVVVPTTNPRSSVMAPARR
jgi:hypothetical protein